MSPIPVVRAQIIVQGLVLAFAGIVGAWSVTLCGIVLTIAVWLNLRQSYVGVLRKSPYDPSRLPAWASRRDLDRRMDHWLSRLTLAALAAMTAGIVGPLEIQLAPAAWAVASAVVLGVSAIVWSSLVDWYWVLPRISGLLGHRPCRVDAEPSGRAISWEEVTRWWIIHRLAALALIACSSAMVVAVLVTALVDVAEIEEPGRSLIAPAFAFLTGVGITLKAFAESWPYVTRPPVRVGSFYRDPDAGAGWVVDVALEGPQLVLLDSHRARLERAQATGLPPQFNPEKGDDRLKLDARPKSAERFEDCQSCSALNWYCAENARAWDKP